MLSLVISNSPSALFTLTSYTVLFTPSEAHMSHILQTPRGAVVAKNIRDLQGRPCHGEDSGERLDTEIFQWTLHLAQEARSDMAVPCGVLDLDVSEQDLDEADVLVMLQKMRGERMAQRMQ
jgi:hypothetical protein